MSPMHPVRRALISVSDKRGLLPFARSLAAMDIEIVSTGGTCKALQEAGVAATEVSAKTGFPEIMDGRVKTLHPVIHGGLLGRRGTDDSVMTAHGIEPIDLLIVNLYPFQESVRRGDATVEETIEQIDIGGPAMIRAAAKNHESVVVIVDPDDYDEVLATLQLGPVSERQRRRLAAKAFTHTASYDIAIAGWLSGILGDVECGERFLYSGERLEVLRYGENPHQEAAFYRDQCPPHGSLAAARQLQGKILSYNNVADADAALQCVRQFDQPACVIVKHANPCGVAVDKSPAEAYQRAFVTDPTSAFGGIIAFNRTLDSRTAKKIIDQQFVEVIVAPDFAEAALAILAHKENVRILETGMAPGEPAAGNAGGRVFHKVSGGLLVQSTDNGFVTEGDLEVVTERVPSPGQVADLLFAWRVAKFVKSNAIVFCRDGMTLGVGAGQMSRVYSTRIAAIKAADQGLELSGSVMASDAFFPFRDVLDSAAEHGIAAIVQPGGSVRDDEVIAAANEHGVAMVFTGMRHFRH
ncbi:MAG TPA: bifunctional phosphoribosylaminoimidazolecarboxamide formyltransferase/IMP cyclohydrolase [Woeseiaceae bacterium]